MYGLGLPAGLRFRLRFGLGLRPPEVACAGALFVRERRWSGLGKIRRGLSYGAYQLGVEECGRGRLLVSLVSLMDLMDLMGLVRRLGRRYGFPHVRARSRFRPELGLGLRCSLCFWLGLGLGLGLRSHARQLSRPRHRKRDLPQLRLQFLQTGPSGRLLLQEGGEDVTQLPCPSGKIGLLVQDRVQGRQGGGAGEGERPPRAAQRVAPRDQTSEGGPCGRPEMRSGAM